jgi:hypothetical protein
MRALDRESSVLVHRARHDTRNRLNLGCAIRLTICHYRSKSICNPLLLSTVIQCDSRYRLQILPCVLRRLRTQ